MDEAARLLLHNNGVTLLLAEVLSTDRDAPLRRDMAASSLVISHIETATIRTTLDYDYRRAQCREKPDKMEQNPKLISPPRDSLAYLP